MRLIRRIYIGQVLYQQVFSQQSNDPATPLALARLTELNTVQSLSSLQARSIGQCLRGIEHGCRFREKLPAGQDAFRGSRQSVPMQRTGPGQAHVCRHGGVYQGHRVTTVGKI